MALSIKNPEVERLARQLARLTDESLTDTILKALQERLERTVGRKNSNDLVEEIHRIQNRIASFPVLDTRCPDDIIGYDERGLPE